MAYVVRTKDDPGDAGRAADQQQSIDNESALYAAVLGNGPVATGGMVKQFVKKTAIADNTATTVFTITTTNEAGNTDGGSYAVVFEGQVVHGGLSTGNNAVVGFRSQFARGVSFAGTGVNSAVIESSETAVAASDAAERTITTVTMTVVETTEYVMSVQFTIDLAGTSITTGIVAGMVTLYYQGLLTPPVITSSG